MSVLRYVIVGLSTAAMIFGVLVIAGVFVPRALPEQFRVVIGIVIFLYGLYRIVVEYSRSRADRE